MRMMMIFAAACLAFAPAAAAAQAFGVTPGTNVSRLNGTPSSTGRKYYYRVTVPLPNREFESYSAIATPTEGVCKIWGIGVDHDNDRYGSSAQSAYDNMKATLSAKYGASKSVEYIKSGALWDKSSEWVMSLRQKERTHVTYWIRGDGATLPAGLDAVSLKISAVSSDSAYLDLTYEFSNFDSCKRRMDSESNEGL